jgi:hypothetical protein
MKKTIENALDEGLTGLQEGKMVETCIALGGDAGEDIAPLLYTAEYLAEVPKAEPSEEFRRSARGRLMARLQQTRPLPARRRGFHLFDALSRAFSHVSIVGPSFIKSAVTFAVIMAVLIGALSFGPARVPVETSNLASQCTLTILGGTVEILTPGGEVASPGVNGMTLDAGTTISTSADGEVLLTFFEGSELELEADTVVKISEVTVAENEAVSITLSQLAGSTWSHVTKMIDKYSKYEIHTPSAVALVRGTYFMTQVESDGKTRVETAEGLVSVAAEGEEVYVPVGKKTIVKPGKTPTVPVIMSVADDNAPEVPRTAQLAEEPEAPQGSLLGLAAPDDGGTSLEAADTQAQDKSDNGPSEDKSNNGQGQDKDNNGPSEDKSNNGQGQEKDNNGQGQDNSNNGQGQDNSNNGQGNGKANKDET